MKLLVELFRAMRPKQWTKNVLVFAALVFDAKAGDPVFFVRCVFGFVVYCLVSGVVFQPFTSALSRLDVLRVLDSRDLLSINSGKAE